MNVNLGSKLDKFVDDVTQREVLREGLRLLKEKEDLRQLRLAELRKAIAVGTTEAESGDFVDGPAAFASIRRRGGTRRSSA